MFSQRDQKLPWPSLHCEGLLAERKKKKIALLLLPNQTNFWSLKISLLSGWVFIICCAEVHLFALHNFDNTFLILIVTPTSSRRWWPISCQTCHLHSWCNDLHVYNGRLFFFCTAPSLWFNCCCIGRKWRTSSCPAAALRRQRQRDRYSSPCTQTCGHPFNSANPERFDPVLHSGEHRRLETRQRCQQTTLYDTHILGKVEPNAAQYPVTSVKSCGFFFLCPVATPVMVLCATNEPRPIRAECEQSCGCDTVRYAVTISVSGMFAEESAEVVIAQHSVHAGVVCKSERGNSMWTTQWRTGSMRKMWRT